MEIFHKVLNLSSGFCYFMTLIPKLLWPVFCSFLKFGQPILVRVFMLNF